MGRISDMSNSERKIFNELRAKNCGRSYEQDNMGLMSRIMWEL